MKYYFFRLDFWIYSRYSESFQLETIPILETQKIMIQIYFDNPEIKELIQKYWLTWFELCED